jgi:uncharacterized protein YecE (DUF72 family)
MDDQLSIRRNLPLAIARTWLFAWFNYLLQLSFILLLAIHAGTEGSIENSARCKEQPTTVFLNPLGSDVNIPDMRNDPLPPLYLGTSSWSASSWEGVFYPPGTKPTDYLAFYATRYSTVEVDSTFYRIPTQAMIKKWDQSTPPHFLFAAKVPQAITHEKVLLDCQEEFRQFLDAMEGLGNKLGPLLLQFPYFNKNLFPSLESFLERLKPFLASLPSHIHWAVEIRNKNWLKPSFYQLLRDHRIAYTLIDQAWMPSIQQILKTGDPLTADFAYIRWLGDRKGIEAITTRWDAVVLDRAADLQQWVIPVQTFRKQGKVVYGFFNNHYSGHAPASLELFQKLLGASPVIF